MYDICFDSPCTLVQKGSDKNKIRIADLRVYSAQRKGSDVRDVRML